MIHHISLMSTDVRQTTHSPPRQTIGHISSWAAKPSFFVSYYYNLHYLPCKYWLATSCERWGCHCPCIYYEIILPQWGPIRLELNLNFSLSCIPSIRLAILHHELSRYVCLITEQLFKSLSSWLLCSYQSRYMLHHSSSGKNSNLLKWRLDSSVMYINLYFSPFAS